jgi:DNA-binding response OmpR family regulator
MQKSKPILLVEDNPDDVDLTIRAFRRNNVSNEIIVARDGVEAIDYLMGENTSLPIIILMDLKLPRLDGKEVLRKIRSTERTKLLPVIILTSSREEEDIIDSYNLGANGYVRKPVDFLEFTEAIKALGLFWLLWNEPPPVG